MGPKCGRNAIDNDDRPPPRTARPRPAKRIVGYWVFKHIGLPTLMAVSYQDVTLTDAQTHEILCGFSTLLDARCVIVEAALARSKAFHRWRRSAAQSVVTPKGSTPKPTLATVAEAAEDATPRKRRCVAEDRRVRLRNLPPAAGARR